MSLKPADLLQAAALREVSGVVEAAEGDFRLDPLKDLLQLLPVCGRVSEGGLLPAALFQIDEVEEQLLVVSARADLTHGKHLHPPWVPARRSERISACPLRWPPK
ncbi:hypothetical protein D9M68_701170 [compost metagenome]